MAARRAEIAGRVAAGWPPKDVAAAYHITESRVSQIVKRVREDERKARCARGEHWGISRSEYEVEQPDGSMKRIVRLTCDHCGAVVLR